MHFFGGRVNGFKLFRNAKPNETIEFIDVTSLYPSVQKFCDFLQIILQLFVKTSKISQIILV